MSKRPRADLVNFSFFDWNGERLHLGGAERYVAELARLLASLGLTPRILQNARAAFTREFEGFEVVGLPLAETMDLVAMSRGFSSAVRGADLVVASPVDLALALSTPAPVIGISHGIHWDYDNNRIDLHDPARDAAIVAAVKACSACVCVDSNFPNWLRCFDATAVARTRRIPNFVDLDAFHPVSKSFGERLEVLFPRRLCRERGFRDVVAAFDDLLPRCPQIDLHLCGEGLAEDEAIAAEFVQRHPGRVRWSRLAMDAMPQAYARSHVVLVPTVFAEGTSLSCLEAMATRNAVVTTMVGGLADLVLDGWNALVIAPGAHAIVAAVERLANERDLAQRLALNALTVVPAFGKPRWTAHWHAVLHEVLPALVPAPPVVPMPALAPEGLERRVELLAGELQSTEAARQLAEQQLHWSSSELAGIKGSTGWALLQALYRVRFALFPLGSRRDAMGRWAMQRARQLARRAKGSPPDAASPAGTGNATPAADALGALPAGVTVETPYAIVCLPILEWSFRFQRPQQLARRFARRGHDVLFIKHSFGATLAARTIEPGIEEIELPGAAGTNPYRDRMDEAQADAMVDALLYHVAQRGLGRFVCVVQLPFWAPLALALRQRSGCDLVYDCMDLHAGFSSNTAAALSDEERLFGTSDVVVCASQQLVEHAAPHARRTALVRNAVDYDHFAIVPDRDAPTGAAWTIGYYGAIADWFDSDLVAGIAQLRPGWRIELVGSTWSADTAPLEALPTIALRGEKPYAELPALISHWDCCIIPFRHTPLTAATNPVKVYEMLAAGKPVVSVRLPELQPMAEAGLVSLAEGPAEFVAAVEAAVASATPAACAARRAYAAANTWDTRARDVEAAIDAIRPLVSIIVVTFGNRDLNELCLASVLGGTEYPDIEVIVVDNASKDGTPELLRSLAGREPRVRVILNDDNRGFSGANNQGAAIARGRYLCFLNNDTVVHGGWLATLIGHLRRHAHLGLVGPVTNAIGNEAKIPVGYGDLAGMPAWADAHCAMHAGRLTDVSMLAFFCVVMPRDVWDRIGPLDERFGPGMFEDDDYNRRVRAAGFDVKLAWDAFVHHWQRASFRLLGEDEYLRIYRENQTSYASKWQGSAEPGTDPLAGLARRASTAFGTVVFAPSVGWAIPLAQRPHHIARVLAQEGYLVVFDCTNAADPIDTLREVEPGLFLYKGEAARLATLPRLTLWAFSYNFDYRDAFPGDAAVIYDWIDDLAVFPYDQRKLAALHARAMSEATVVLSVARRLHERAVAARGDALYMPNAVEEGRFEREPQPNVALDDPAFRALLDAGRPIVGYYGALAHWFDYDLLAKAANMRADWSFVLIGPDHDGSFERSGVGRLPNVHWLGPKPYLALPGYLHRFDVAMIPFAINDITLATSPLKLYEYFAAAKPVISTPMPECSAFDEVRIVENAQAFAAALDEVRQCGRDEAFRSRLVGLARANTWRARVRATMDAVERARAASSWGAAPGEEAISLTSGAVAMAAPGRTEAGRASVGALLDASTSSAPGERVGEADPVPALRLPASLSAKPFLKGTCNVCGRRTRFFRDDPSLDRESLTCEHCRTTSRYRSVAKGLLKAIYARSGIHAASIAELPAHADASLCVYDTQAPFFFDPCAYPLPDLLKRCGWIEVTVSSYRPGEPLGAVLQPGVVNQNLEALTFPDASFDVLITSDVMEHVRLDDRAHAEIARVLKPGGVYLFTVPHFRDRRDTFVRVRVHDPKDPDQDEYVTVPEYHGDANAPSSRGVLSYRSYGTELDDALQRLGFDVTYTFEDDDAHGIRNCELFYCVRSG